MGIDDAFDIAYTLLELKAEIAVSSSIPTSSNWKSKYHFDFFFLVHALIEDPFRSEFYLEDAPKGIRQHFFYITYVTKCPMSTIIADDNGANVKTRNTTKLYCQVGHETKRCL